MLSIRAAKLHSLKVGQIVKIKSADDCVRVESADTPGFVDEMEKYCGKIKKVQLISNPYRGTFRLKDCEFIWCVDYVDFVNGLSVE